MTIEDQIKEILRLHDEYSEMRYSEDVAPVISIDMFNDWHSKSSVLFSKYISPDDTDFQRFKNIEKGNSYTNAGIFSDIESYFQILIEKIRTSVPYQLELLIEEGNAIRDKQNDRSVPKEVSLYLDEDKIVDDLSYQTWKNKCLRLLNVYFKAGCSLANFTKAANSFDNYSWDLKYLNEMIAILMSCKDIPSVHTTKTGNVEQPSTSPVTINVNQSQSQCQTQVIDIFLESISDEITRKQLKELKAITKEEPKPEEAKSKILEKVKTFGSDVLSNIVANIITNPAVWGGL